jgi:hypothetical protein
MDPGQERRAKNEAIFREVNERVEEVETRFAGYGEQDRLLIGFICECGRDDCTEQLEVAHAHYESVRDDSRRFLVLPGHEQTDIERVIERHHHFLVVEKMSEAAEIADENDPRS